jgi:hypothetical protein
MFVSNSICNELSARTTRQREWAQIRIARSGRMRLPFRLFCIGRRPRCGQLAWRRGQRQTNCISFSWRLRWSFVRSSCTYNGDAPCGPSPGDLGSPSSSRRRPLKRPGRDVTLMKDCFLIIEGQRGRRAHSSTGARACAELPAAPVCNSAGVRALVARSFSFSLEREGGERSNSKGFVARTAKARRI